jgi:CRISPR-associated protein Csx17
LCRDDSPSRLQPLIAAFGAAERTLARSFKWTSGAYLRPLQGLKQHWLEEGNDNSPEFRLAQCVAGTRAWLGNETLWFRQHLEPLVVAANNDRSWVSWDDTPSNDVAWHDGDLTDALNGILLRRAMRIAQSGAQGWPDTSPRFARLDDIADFIEGRTNDTLLADLIWGLSLLDWQGVKPLSPECREAPEAIPSSFYALLRLCFRPANGKDDTIPLVPAILHRSMNGDGQAASALAARRLRASGQAPLVDDLPVCGATARRTAAAMLFPIARKEFMQLERSLLKQLNTQNT